MNEHLAHLNPHPQYVLKNEVDGNNHSLSEKSFFDWDADEEKIKRTQIAKRIAEKEQRKQIY